MKSFHHYNLENNIFQVKKALTCHSDVKSLPINSTDPLLHALPKFCPLHAHHTPLSEFVFLRTCTRQFSYPIFNHIGVFRNVNKLVKAFKVHTEIFKSIRQCITFLGKEQTQKNCSAFRNRFRQPTHDLVQTFFSFEVIPLRKAKLLLSESSTTIRKYPVYSWVHAFNALKENFIFIIVFCLVYATWL